MKAYMNKGLNVSKDRIERTTYGFKNTIAAVEGTTLLLAVLQKFYDRRERIQRQVASLPYSPLNRPLTISIT